MSFETCCVDDSFRELVGEDSKKYDVTITDPPYNVHVQSNLCSGSLVGTKSVPKYDLPFKPIAGFEFIKDLLRVTKRWVLVFCAVEDFGRIADSYPSEYVRGGIWYKKNAMGQLTADRPATAYEGIAILHPKDVKKRWNGNGSYGIWQCNGTRGKKDRHPNEKPLPLCRKLVALFSDRTETVFDPFCGSGAIGEAAVSLNRNYVGWDSDASWVIEANRRLFAADENGIRLTDGQALTECAMKEIHQ